MQGEWDCFSLCHLILTSSITKSKKDEIGRTGNTLQGDEKCVHRRNHFGDFVIDDRIT